MANYPRPEAGDLYEDKDSRSKGRVVRVVSVAPAWGDAQVETEVHPKIPSAVGRITRVSWKTLATRYKKVSR